MKHMLLIALTLFVMMVCLADDSDAAVSNSVVISEVSPDDEAFTLKNVGTSPIDLKGYSVTDGEGTISFVSYSLAAGNTVTVSKESGTDWFNSRDGVLTFTSSKLTKTGSFTLANSGDEVSLLRDGNLADSVCYGKSSGVEGWIGEPVGTSSGHYLLRLSETDSDTQQDWISTKPGWTHYYFDYDSGFDAIVHPFSFPESKGEPVLCALGMASEFIDISIYLMSSPKVVSVLCQMLSEGVEVRVLVEGSPLGVDISTELSLLKSLTEKGAEVRIINYSGSSDCRYSYVHNKYAVIDGQNVLITSENWTSGNIGEYGNRGWGALIESVGYASFMSLVFENDFSGNWGDVRSFEELYPRCKAYSGLPQVSLQPYDVVGYAAVVKPVLSPDNSYSALEDVISHAESRIYAEQMDLGSSLSTVTGDSPIFWLSSAANRGVDTKFILDSSQSNGTAHESSVNLISSATSIKAITVNGTDDFSLIHNKGVIVDDCVWVGSVNWTETSFHRNRETAVFIESSEVADYFATLFLSDFGINEYTVEENGLDLVVQVFDSPNGKMVLMCVNGPDDCTYSWDLGNGMKRTSNNNCILFESPAEGFYTARVSMGGSDLVADCSYNIDSECVPSDQSIPKYSMLLAISILLLGAIVALVRGRSLRVSNAVSSSYRPYR